MASFCKTCTGPIEPPNQHDNCIAATWLIWGEAAGEALPSPHSPVTFPEDGFHSPWNIADFVLFGREEEDSMSISASEKEDWVEMEHDCPVSEGPPDLQEELVRVMTTVIQELKLSLPRVSSTPGILD